jgi:hypothetical protein
MFSYDQAIAAALEKPPQTIADVLEAMRVIDTVSIDQDGLKWFNWLYFAVTRAVEDRVSSGGFSDPAWLAELDVQFARLYFNAVRAALTGVSYPGCWRAMLTVRGNASLARIQFALAGMNAHINHDLCEAIVETCKVTNTVPRHGSVQYTDFTALNSTLDLLIEQAKQTLQVRLPGDPLPGVSHLEDLIAGWKVSAAREGAWINGEALWNLAQPLGSGFLNAIDGITTVIGKALLVPVP